LEGYLKNRLFDSLRVKKDNTNVKNFLKIPIIFGFKKKNYKSTNIILALFVNHLECKKKQDVKIGE
jgi:hypothetical protein